MTTISLSLAVLATLFFGWLGYKYQESFFLNVGTKKGREVRVPFVSDLGLLVNVLLTMVLVAVAIAMTLL